MSIGINQSAPTTPQTEVQNDPVSAPSQNNTKLDALTKKIDDMLSSIFTELPDLSAPLMASGLSLEVLLEAVGAKQRKTMTEATSTSLKAKAQEQKEANDKKLKELQNNLEKLNKKETLSKVSKGFKIFGLIVSAIAAVATTALGVMTGNPLMVAAGVMMTALVVDSIVSSQTEGKHGISAWTASLAQKMGASEKTAKWIGFGTSMLFTAVAIGLSIGSAFTAKSVEVVTKTMIALSRIQAVGTGLIGVNAIAGGALTIAEAKLDSDIAKNKARNLEMDALLERLKETFEIEEDFLKFLVENLNDLTSKISDIVNEAASAQMAILSGGSPSMA
ncbi:MAG: type III secretion system translocon subunit SctE [Deltaproteobacteria bacterium]|jgi:hypothetical protein|nr:type III secretion system translocon subunit SctE [Deltaproteobacteria bacterium]